MTTSTLEDGCPAKAPRRKIVICSDGTGNRGGLGRDTNVWRIYKAAAGKESERQFAIYDDGVGTEDNLLKRLLGGALGMGLSENIRELYLSLCNVYEPGADIYLFGFSRGAHTVRALAGFITSQGILNPRMYQSDEALAFDIWLLFDAYRSMGHVGSGRIGRFPLLKAPIRTPPEIRGGPERDRYRRIARDSAQRAVDLTKARGRRHSHETVDWAAHELSEDVVAALTAPPAVGNTGDGTGQTTGDERLYRVPIRFMGLWDTVDAVGFPLDWIADYWDAFVYRFRFRNYKLSPLIQRACHALAIDEARQAFRPRLIDVTDEPKLGDAAAEHDGAAPARIHQIWYSGSHSNVGGGYPKQGLAHVSLGWIAGEAKNEGLRLEQTDVTGGLGATGDNATSSATPVPFSLYASETNAHDKLYNSRTGIASLYAYQPRDVGRLHRDHHTGAPEAQIDRTVVERIARRTFAYSPWNLPGDFAIANDTDDATSPAATLAERWRANKEKRKEEIDAIISRATDQTAFQTNVKLVFAGLVYAVFVALAIGFVDSRGAVVSFALVIGAAAFAHASIDKRLGREIARQASATWWPLVFPLDRDADGSSTKDGPERGLNLARALSALAAIGLTLLAIWLLEWSALWPALLFGLTVYVGGKACYELAGFRERRCRKKAGRELQRRKLGYGTIEAETYLRALAKLPPGTTAGTGAEQGVDPNAESKPPDPSALDDYARTLQIDCVFVLLYGAALCTLLVTVLGIDGPIVFPFMLVVAYLVADLAENALLLRAVRSIQPKGEPLAAKRLAETLLAASFWTVVKFWTIPAILVFVVLAGSTSKSITGDSVSDTSRPISP